MTSVRLPLSLVSILTAFSLLLCGAALPAWGQTTTMGTITGLVTDQSNAVIPDATVTVKDIGTKDVRTITTNAAGRYVFVNLPPGTYDITFSKTGFATVSISKDVVQVGMVSTHNVVLNV